MSIGALRLVLLRTRNADNLGAVARAMRNFGVRDWALVQPYASLADATRTAVHAEDLLSSARVVDRLEEAVEGCVWIVGTSSRAVRGKVRLGAREVAQEIVSRLPSGPVALVFGDERSGLTNEHVDRCHALSSVGADEAQPSLNLAQAALLYCWEVHRAWRDASPPPPRAEAAPATAEELSAIADALRDALSSSGFLRTNPDRAIRELVAPFSRARLLRREAELWRAALTSLGRRGGTRR